MIKSLSVLFICLGVLLGIHTTVTSAYAAHGCSGAVYQRRVVSTYMAEGTNYPLVCAINKCSVPGTQRAVMGTFTLSSVPAAVVTIPIAIYQVQTGDMPAVNCPARVQEVF